MQALDYNMLLSVRDKEVVLEERQRFWSEFVGGVFRPVVVVAVRILLLLLLDSLDHVRQR